MNNKFIKSTLILFLGGAITRLLAFIIKIYFTRVIGEDGIKIYSIIMPTYSLMIAICQLGFPIAISNIIASSKKRGFKIFSSIIPLAMLINTILIFIVIICANYLSNNLLHNQNTYYPLICLSFVLPFISISSIFRGYFFGKQQMLPHSISNIIEQLFKLLIVLIILPKVLKYGLLITICVYILISILSETMSIIIFLLYLPKNFKIKLNELKPDFVTMKEVMQIGLPTIGSKLIGNIGYFLEPIIITTFMLKAGYSNDYILTNYSVYNTYVLGILLVPTYFQMSISTSLLPEISKNKLNKLKVKLLLKKIILISIIIGLISNITIFIFSKEILWIVFKTTKGINYLKIMAIFFTLYYLEAPIATTLQAYNENNYLLKTSIISIIIKLSSIIILSFTNIGIYNIILSELIDIIIILYLNIKKLMKIIS